MMQKDYPHGRIELVKGNIVDQDVDAIVNAANTTLAGGGGVDGAIHRAAGPGLLKECLALPEYEPGRRCPTGECRVTGGGKLRARFVIHAVGPVYNDRSPEKAESILRQVHLNSLQAAAEKNCGSVAFPAISTGAYRFPIEEAAPIALTAAKEFLSQPTSVQLVRFVLFSQPDYQVFANALAKM
jgi:O-acetyl-ADP-ribose deacetylase (regulator of RNase III)